MEKGKRNPRIGILIGACLIAAGAYVPLFLGVFYTMVLFFLVGGLASGIYSSRTVWDGVWYGLLSGIAGAFLIMIPIVGILISGMIEGQPADFAEGMALFLGIFISLAAIMLAAAGGGIGVAVKRAFFGESELPV
jgi:hypothetical protein